MKESRLLDVAPGLCAELRQGLRAEAKEELAAQIDSLLVHSWRHDKEDDVLLISVRGGRQLTSVEKRMGGEGPGLTISLDSLEGVVSIDTDNLNRITGIEAIGRSDLAEAFQQHGL